MYLLKLGISIQLFNPIASGFFMSIVLQSGKMPVQISAELSCVDIQPLTTLEGACLPKNVVPQLKISKLEPLGS